jgi:hypothetical protein
MNIKVGVGSGCQLESSADADTLYGHHSEASAVCRLLNTECETD